MQKESEINRIVSLIFTTSRLIRERSKGKDHPDPISFLRLETLRYVADHKNPTMREIALYLCITPPSTTSLIDDLVKSKMLERVFDKNDRRIVRLSVTEKGRETIRKGFGQIAKRFKKVLLKLSADDRENLVMILEKLSQAYSK